MEVSVCTLLMVSWSESMLSCASLVRLAESSLIPARASAMSLAGIASDFA